MNQEEFDAYVEQVYWAGFRAGRTQMMSPVIEMVQNEEGVFVEQVQDR